MFNSIIRDVGNINIAFKYLPSEATGKELGDKKLLFDCFDKSWIETLAMLDIKIMVKLGGMTHQVEPSEARFYLRST